MNKLYLLSILLLVTNVCTFTMNLQSNREASNTGWESETDISYSSTEYPVIIQGNLDNNCIASAISHTHNWLKTIEENPHMPHIDGSIVSIENFNEQIKGQTIVYPKLLNRSNYLNDRITNLIQTRSLNTSPISNVSPITVESPINNRDEDIMDMDQD